MHYLIHQDLQDLVVQQVTQVLQVKVRDQVLQVHQEQLVQQE